MDLRTLYVNAKQRWVAAGYPDYPAWVPLLFHACTLGAGLAAVIQRSGAGDAGAAALLVGLAMLPYAVCEVVSPRLAPWWLFALFSLGALSVLMWRYPVDLDFAIPMLAMIVGRFGALETMWRSAVVCAVAVAAVTAVSAPDALDEAAYAFAVLVVAWDIGWIMQSQQRRIDQQKREQASREAKAALEERQRIAREVHDVVAHSLSVTLLHLTAARRDLEDGGEVAEAISALKDAEHVGRQAMNDIRQAVGLLGTGDGGLSAAPELSDVPQLVEQFRAAGLDLTWQTAGDPSALSAAARTGIYRILQESLANIAKHEPGASATVALDLSSARARLEVRNTLTRPVNGNGGGSGIRGMSERAASLGARFSAGPATDGTSWQVLVELGQPREHPCPLRRAARETA